jgi:16S rRNA (guanine1207-N2)-methyltransferase
MSAATDIFFKKIVTLKYGKHILQFRVAQELFSSHEVDAGTKFLLRTLNEVAVGRKILDVGCGYGPIGLTLKRQDTQRVVHLVDRDALALDYTCQNATLNQLASGIEVYGSLGYDAVRDADFDLIVSNIPGKMSAEAIEHFLLDGRYYLSPNGLMAVVVVNPLREIVKAILDSVPEVTILLEQAASRYTVFHYKFDGERPSAPSTTDVIDIYQRDTMQVTADAHTFTMQTARGLPEFDELGHHTKLLLKTMVNDVDNEVKRVLVFNPGQGHTAVAAWYAYQPEQLVLVDRDLLSLYYTRHNLLQNGCPAEQIVVQHQVGIEVEQTAERIICILRGTEGLKGAEWVMKRAVEQLGENGRILTAANSHLITQLTTRLPKQVKVKERKKRKGNSLVMLQKV